MDCQSIRLALDRHGQYKHRTVPCRCSRPLSASLISFSWWRTKDGLRATDVLLMSFTEISMFPFCGRGSFQIGLARRRAHPCDEQAVASTCSFSLFFHLKNA